MPKTNSIGESAQSPIQTEDDVVPAGPPPVVNLFESCSSFWRDVLTALSQDASIERSILVSLKRSLSYLVLWADGFGVGGERLGISLSKSKRVRATTLRLLLSISRTLIERLLLFVATDQQPPLISKATELACITAQVEDLSHQGHNLGSDSDTDSDVSSDDGDRDLGEIAEDLRTDTQCLLDLGSRFQEPAVGSIVAEPAVKLEPLRSQTPAQNLADGIHQRHPQGEGGSAEQLRTPSPKNVTSLIQEFNEDGSYPEFLDTSLPFDLAIGNGFDLDAAKPVSHEIARTGIQDTPIQTYRDAQIGRTPSLDSPEVMSSTRDGSDATKETELYPNNFSMVANHWGSYRQTMRYQHSENSTDDTETMIREHELFTSTPKYLQPSNPGVPVPRESPASSDSQQKQKLARTRKVRIVKPCSNCRQQRIICDEKRPSCSQCVRSKKLCAGYPPTPTPNVPSPITPQCPGDNIQLSP
ncbi:hypothetical protein EsH8_VI_000104 [Colletotrichum jinshuiense]